MSAPSGLRLDALERSDGRLARLVERLGGSSRRAPATRRRLADDLRGELERRGRIGRDVVGPRLRPLAPELADRAEALLAELRRAASELGRVDAADARWDRRATALRAVVAERLVPLEAEIRGALEAGLDADARRALTGELEPGGPAPRVS